MEKNVVGGAAWIAMKSPAADKRSAEDLFLAVFDQLGPLPAERTVSRSKSETGSDLLVIITPLVDGATRVEERSILTRYSI